MVALTKKNALYFADLNLEILIMSFYIEMFLIQIVAINIEIDKEKLIQ